MSRALSIDKNFIFVGDIYKNFQIYKLRDEEELKKQKIDDKNIISLLKRYQAKSDAHCVFIHPFSALKDDLKGIALFSASQDGFLRLYSIKSQKNLECSAQINLKDNILRVMPILGEHH